MRSVAIHLPGRGDAGFACSEPLAEVEFFLANSGELAHDLGESDSAGGARRIKNRGQEAHVEGIDTELDPDTGPLHLYCNRSAIEQGRPMNLSNGCAAQRFRLKVANTSETLTLRSSRTTRSICFTSSGSRR